jgi:hypothetical protein
MARDVEETIKEGENGTVQHKDWVICEVKILELFKIMIFGVV